MATPSSQTLQQQLSDTWRTSPILEGKSHVVDASAGSWMARPSCKAPKLIALLSGHFRTFSYTREILAQTLDQSSDRCYFVAAAVSTDIDGTQHMPWVAAEYRGADASRSSYTDLWKALAGVDGSHHGVPYHMRQSARLAFGSRLAFAVLRRSGDHDRWPGGLAVGWHAAWAVLLWAARHHKLRIPSDAVIVRTRPDVLLRTPFEIESLRHYFRRGGAHGRHLMLDADVKEGAHWYAQSDYFAITSFGAFTTDVALPLEYSGRWNRTDLCA